MPSNVDEIYPMAGTVTEKPLGMSEMFSENMSSVGNIDANVNRSSNTFAVGLVIV